LAWSPQSCRPAWLEARGTHDEIYDEDYYARIVDPDALNSASKVAATIVQEFHPRSIIDVGCGSEARGFWYLQPLAERWR